MSQTLRNLLNESDPFFQSDKTISLTEDIVTNYLIRVVLKDDYELGHVSAEDISASRINIETVTEVMRNAVSDYLHSHLPIDHDGNINIDREDAKLAI